MEYYQPYYSRYNKWMPIKERHFPNFRHHKIGRTIFPETAVPSQSSIQAAPKRRKCISLKFEDRVSQAALAPPHWLSKISKTSSNAELTELHSAIINDYAGDKRSLVGPVSLFLRCLVRNGHVSLAHELALSHLSTSGKIFNVNSLVRNYCKILICSASLEASIPKGIDFC